ncbi:MAG TPA: oxygen-independent coproporphyrinogen III oxidase [Usitatibacteraceae bacterium]|nr:oxygen-independent coproporphyrinogen III oxidase [Usitatibacteraceae bacterium]
MQAKSRQQAADDLVVDPQIIAKYDKPGPRYTSYPTADRFVEAFDQNAQRLALRARGLTLATQPLSLYVHLPFCDTICFYCGCNKIATRDHGRSAKYLRYLDREFELVAKEISGPRRVEQVHLGGGTPTFLSSEELRQLLESMRRHFDLQPGEYAIEIDPRSVDVEKIKTLAEIGFNRASLGVQDFDPLVQKAVNRLQSEEITIAAIDALRANGFRSINIDLIYGLPKQTLAGFYTTLEKVIAIKPDRIALYSYAHLPGMFKPQRRIQSEDLPTPDAKLAIMSLAIRTLAEAGYVYVGMDHFALPDDELAVAATQGRLHRNFQGYSTRPDCDLLAFGVSAISKIGNRYAQNVRTLEPYYDALDHDELPVFRGLELTADDMLRRAVIQALMCHFSLSIESIELAHLIKFREYFAQEWELLESLQEEGLVELSEDWITVTPKGRLLVRVVAMVFDRYLARDTLRERFSKLI